MGKDKGSQGRGWRGGRKREKKRNGLGEEDRRMEKEGKKRRNSRHTVHKKIRNVRRKR